MEHLNKANENNANDEGVLSTSISYEEPIEQSLSSIIEDRTVCPPDLPAKLAKLEELLAECATTLLSEEELLDR